MNMLHRLDTPFVVRRLDVLIGLALAITLGALVRADSSSGTPRFCFWYENWSVDTWNKVQPSSVIIGVSPNAVRSIHQHGGRAIAYITLYQSVFGSDLLSGASDLPNVAFEVDGGYLRSVFPRPNNYVLCPNSEELRKRVTALVRRRLLDENYDGLFIDNGYLEPAASKTCHSKGHRHTLPGADGTLSYLTLLEYVRAQAQRIRPGALLISNPGSPSAANKLTRGSLGIWDLSDFVVWESYGFTSYVGAKHQKWAEIIGESRQYLNDPKARKLLVLSYPQTLEEARYSFAIAKVFGFEWTANLGERERGTGRPGGHFGAFLRDSFADTGSALGPPEYAPILRRRFVKGDLLVNDADKLCTVSFHDPVETKSILTLQPGGAIFLRGVTAGSMPVVRCR